MKLFGLAICIATIFGAAYSVGLNMYFDILSFLFVLGGAIGFVLMKSNSHQHIRNFGVGAVYFGWVGTLIGLIAITGDRLLVWGNIEKMGPALAVALLTLFYGYTFKLLSIAFTENQLLFIFHTPNLCNSTYINTKDGYGSCLPIFSIYRGIYMYNFPCTDNGKDI